MVEGGTVRLSSVPEWVSEWVMYVCMYVCMCWCLCLQVTTVFFACLAQKQREGVHECLHLCVMLPLTVFLWSLVRHTILSTHTLWEPQSHCFSHSGAQGRLPVVEHYQPPCVSWYVCVCVCVCVFACVCRYALSWGSWFTGRSEPPYFLLIDLRWANKTSASTRYPLHSHKKHTTPRCSLMKHTHRHTHTATIAPACVSYFTVPSD